MGPLHPQSWTRRHPVAQRASSRSASPRLPSSHTYVSTSEGQASVVKGDSLVLLDDSNSYWWLVNVLKTEEVGYIPAENIETPFERLARLNKLRNVDVSPSLISLDTLSGYFATQ